MSRRACLAPGCREPVGDRCRFYCGPACRKRVTALQRTFESGADERADAAHAARREALAWLGDRA